VVQNRFYAQTGYDREIRALCRQRGIVYQGFWTLTANPQVLAQGIVMTLASRYGRTPAQILFRYLTQEDVVPLTGTTSAAHMREDLAIFDFELTEMERDAVRALFRDPGAAAPEALVSRTSASPGAARAIEHEVVGPAQGAAVAVVAECLQPISGPAADCRAATGGKT